MGKLADLAAVSSSSAASFVYVPPAAAFDATRILVKPQLGFAPAVNRMVLDKVLRGLRRANPYGRIVLIDAPGSDNDIEAIYEHYGLAEILDDNMRAGNAEQMIMADYENLLPDAKQVPFLTAPTYVGDYDCCISVSTFSRSMVQDEQFISASLRNILGLVPHDQLSGKDTTIAELLRAVYFTLGHYFDGAVVDLSADAAGQVVWGNDLLAVDEVACRIAGEPIASYIEPIRAARKILEQANDQ